MLQFCGIFLHSLSFKNNKFETIFFKFILDNVGKFVDPQELKNIIPGKSNRFKKIPFITTGKRTPVLT